MVWIAKTPTHFVQVASWLKHHPGCVSVLVVNRLTGEIRETPHGTKPQHIKSVTQEILWSLGCETPADELKWETRHKPAIPYEDA